MAFRILLAFALLVPSLSLLAQEPPAKEAPAADEKPDDGKFYEVPESDPKELREFIVRMLSFQPKTRLEAINHQAKAIGAVREAAERMLKVVEDKSAVNYLMAQAVLLQIDIQDLRRDSKAEAKGVVDRTLAFVKKIGKDAGGMEVELLFMLGEALEPVESRRGLAVKVYREGGKMLAEATDERIQSVGDRLKAMGRRADLAGKKMKLNGDTYAGKDFDIKSLEGKVVLVQFWATWCGACLGEMPNMQANYERFGKHGFEIVGVSLDEDREALDSFLERRELPWVILHQNDDKEGNAAASYYGISAIPAMFLIDREGKVITTSANGGALTRLLEEQFPKVVATEEDSADE